MTTDRHMPTPSRSEGELVFDSLAAIVGALDAMPLGRLLSTVVTHRTTAPLLDPTAYINGGAKNLEDQERLLRAAINLVDVARAIKAGQR